MTHILESILLWAERQLPEDRRMWISDLRSESKHIASRFARQQFILSGILAAMGQILRFNFGVQRVGQTLLGAALLILCVGGSIFATSIEDAVVRTAFNFVMPLYAATGALALSSLRGMKYFTFGCSLIFALVWVVFGLEAFSSSDIPIAFLRAFSIEVSFIMAGLFIAASYLGWAGDTDHA